MQFFPIYFYICTPITIAYFLWEMKRTFALLVATLCYFCTYSQEAETVGNTPVLTVIPRFDVNPHIPVGNKGGEGFDFANSSLYTLFEGNVGEHFSYSMSNHWVSTDTKSLYQNAFRSDDVNFVDWLTLTATAGKFSFTIGKDMLSIGGYELDAYDVDSHIDLSSTFWNNCAIYQWGGKVAFEPTEESSIAFQFATSPFGERPFKSKLFTYSLYWAGEYGCFSPIWSANFMEYERGRFISILSLGNRFDIGNFAIELDYMNRANSTKRFFDQEMTLTGKLIYTLGDKAEFFVKGGYEYCHGEEGDMFGYGDEWEMGDGIVPTGIVRNKDYVFYGGGVHLYPLRNSKDLRLHAVVAANNYSNHVALTVGATYYFNLTDTILRHRKR